MADTEGNREINHCSFKSLIFFFNSIISSFILIEEIRDYWVGNPMDGGAWWAAVHGVAKSRTQLSDFPLLFTFMHWRRKWQPTPVFLPGESQGPEESSGLLSMGSHRVGHD